VPGLLAALVSDPAADGAHLVDGTGRVQPLVAVYRRAPLRAALDRLPDRGRGCSMRQVVAGMALTRVVDADGHGADADTWDDVATLEARIRRDDMDLGRTRDTPTSGAEDGAPGDGDPMSGLVTVRYFAAAAEAAGVMTETLQAVTVGALVAAMVESHGPGLATVLARCSLLAAGVRVAEDATPLADGVTVDVLPPFAGG